MIKESSRWPHMTIGIEKIKIYLTTMKGDAHGFIRK